MRNIEPINTKETIKLDEQREFIAELRMENEQKMFTQYRRVLPCGKLIFDCERCGEALCGNCKVK